MRCSPSLALRERVPSAARRVRVSPHAQISSSVVPRRSEMADVAEHGEAGNRHRENDRPAPAHEGGREA